jgi:hypothetical protein
MMEAVYSFETLVRPMYESMWRHDAMDSYLQLASHYRSQNNKHICTGGADNSLTRPGRKQATAAEDFEFHISYL